MSKLDRDTLSDAVATMYEINRNVPSVEPDFLARGAMEIIKFDYGTHHVGWYGCYQHCCQLARAYCRGRFDPAARAAMATSGMVDLFPETLQDRYPLRPRPDREPTYVLRDHLPEPDRWYNIDQLRKVSRATARHADALETETVHLFGKRKAEVQAEEPEPVA